MAVRFPRKKLVEGSSETAVLNVADTASGTDGLSRYRQNEEHGSYAVFEKRWYHGC